MKRKRLIAVVYQVFLLAVSPMTQRRRIYFLKRNPYPLAVCFLIVADRSRLNLAVIYRLLVFRFTTRYSAAYAKASKFRL